MSFPTTPSNGQIATVNGVSYIYSNATNSWTRIVGLNQFGNLTANGYILANGNITSNGSVIASGFYWANGTPFASSSYGNTDVAAYLGPYYTYANANAASQATSIDTINANLGAYQIYANTNAATQATSINTINANLGAYQSYANTSINTINANLGAYQTYANANAATQATSIATLQSQVYSNSNVSSYLPTYSGNISAGNVITNDGIFWSNGTRFRPGGTHSTGTAPHANPAVGDTWYNTSDNIYYQYIDSGESTVWVDFESPILTYNGNTMLYLGAPGNINITGGNSGDLLGTDGAGHLSWNTPYGNTNVASYLQATGIQNIPIGNATPSTGAYTTLSASGVTTITNSSNSTSTTTGALVVSGGVGVSGNLNISGNIQANVNGYSIGYSEIPQISFAANTTLALTDSSKHYYSTSASVLGLTIPTNANVAFNIGTVITVVNAGTGSIKVQPASGVTLYMGGNSTSTTRTIATYGVGTLMKVATNSWFINGAGVS